VIPLFLNLKGFMLSTFNLKVLIQRIQLMANMITHERSTAKSGLCPNPAEVLELACKYLNGLSARVGNMSSIAV
jgi:hypothetical protein